MKPITLLPAGLLAAILIAAPGWCHGVMGTVDEIRAHCITAMYDDGEPMSYAAVEIKAPGTDIPFQSGRTDRNGCFTIHPDTPGTWKAVLSDGIGHRLALDFPVLDQPESAAAAQGPEAASKRPVVSTVSPKTNRYLKVICGLSLIFGLGGFYYGWKARRGRITGAQAG